MFLKIQYGPTSSKYYTNFSSLDYVSHLDENAPIIVAENHVGDDILLNDEFLDDEKGCAKHEDRKNAWYVNSIVLRFQSKNKEIIYEPVIIRYTGNAYLCNSDGKTVDIIR